MLPNCLQGYYKQIAKRRRNANKREAIIKKRILHFLKEVKKYAIKKKQSLRGTFKESALVY